MKGEERTVDREPQEDPARLDTAANLIYPCIVERHPLRACLNGYIARARAVPEFRCAQILPRANGVDRPFAARGEGEHLEEEREDRTGGGRADVAVAAGEEDERAEEEDDSWKGVGEPEADILRQVGQSLAS
jgi:hypothetical protein